MQKDGLDRKRREADDSSGVVSLVEDAFVDSISVKHGPRRRSLVDAAAA